MGDMGTEVIVQADDEADEIENEAESEMKILVDQRDVDVDDDEVDTKEARKNTAALWRRELALLMKLAVPLSATKFVVAITRVVALSFVGRMSPRDDLAGASLAGSVAGVSGYSLMVAFVGGLSTLGAQRFGAGDKNEVGRLTRLSVMLMIALFSILILPLWLCSKALLTRLGQDENVSAKAAKFLWFNLPGVILFGLRQCIQTWAGVQYVVLPFTINAIITAAIALPVSYYMVKYDGYIGAAASISVTSVVQITLDFGYAWASGLHAKTQLFKLPGKDAFRGVGRMLWLSLSSCIMLAEWWAGEITVLLAGRLASDDVVANERTLAAMGIFGTMNGTLFMVPLGVVIAVSARVGNEIGAGNPSTARRATVVAVALSTTVSLIDSTALILGRDIFASSFTNDSELASMLSSVVFGLALYHIIDGYCEAIVGSLEGCGRQAMMAPVVVFSHYAVGIPVSCFLGFYRHLGIVGLVTGRVCGKACQAIIITVMGLRTDFREECRRAERLAALQRDKGGGTVSDSEVVGLQESLLPSDNYHKVRGCNAFGESSDDDDDNESDYLT